MLWSMASRQEPLTEYVRMRIEEWRKSGRELQELARIAGIAKSSPSTVLSGTGVGRKAGTGYAIAFGFGSRSNPQAAYDEMQDAAFSWWRSERLAKPEPLSKPDAANQSISDLAAILLEVRANMIDLQRQVEALNSRLETESTSKVRMRR